LSYRSGNTDGKPAYTLTALFPDRVTAIATVALAYQPRGGFRIPSFEQGWADNCDPPSESEGLEKYFTGRCLLITLEGVGHFPHRNRQTVSPPRCFIT
jgi:hypothetical protein